MTIITFIIAGFITAAIGSIVPSFLNLTVVKFSLKNGRKSAMYLIGGFATILFLQANIGAYLSSILMENSGYIGMLQKLGTGILILLSANFFRLHFKRSSVKRKHEIEKSRAYMHGIGMSLLNTFAVPFYFTAISILTGIGYFEYSIQNGILFSIGSTIGSFSIYSVYAMVAQKIERQLSDIATRMNLILASLTGVVGIGNLIYLLV